MSRIAACDGDQHVVGKDARIKKLKGLVLGGFYGGDVAGQASERWTKFSPWFAESQPTVAIGSPIVLVALGFYAFQKPLINIGVLSANLLSAYPKQVNDHDVAGRVGQVAALAVVADDVLRWPRAPTPALSRGQREQECGFFAGDDRTFTVQLGAWR